MYEENNFNSLIALLILARYFPHFRTVEKCFIFCKDLFLPISGYNLTAHSVLRLFGSCPHLQCVGDLRYWSISFEDRREMFRQMQTHQGCRKMVNHCFEMTQQNHGGAESPWIARRRQQETENQINLS